MKWISRIFCIGLLLFGPHPFIAIAYGEPDTLVIQSLKISPYDEVFEGFKETVQGSVERMLLTDTDPFRVAAHIKRRWPAAVFCIGGEALDSLRRIPSPPIVYAMVLDPPGTGSRRNDFSNRMTGIRMDTDPREQMEIFKEAFPKTKTVGMLYQPGGDSGKRAIDAAEAVEAFGMKTLSVRISDAAQGVDALNTMAGRIDAFWMLPDLSVWSPETVEYLFLVSIRDRIPVLTFSMNYMKMGAVMAIGMTPRSVGRQAGEIVNRLGENDTAGEAAFLYPDKTRVAINMKIAEKLGAKDIRWSIKARNRMSRRNPTEIQMYEND